MALSERHGLALVVAAVLLALAGGWFAATTLSIDPRVEALLPADTASAEALDELRERWQASSEPLYLVIESSDAEQNRRVAEHLAQELSRWPETTSVLRRRDPTFFVDNLLLYLPAEELDGLSDRVEEITEWYECDAVPGCINLDDRPDEPTERELRDLVWERSETAELVQILGASSDRSDGPSDGAGAAGDVADEHLGELCNDGGTVCVVQASMRGDVSNTDYAIEISNKAEALIAQTQSELDLDAVRIVTSGRYRNVPLIRQAVATDVQLSAMLSLTLVLLVLLAHLRGPRALLVLVLPILIATGWTAGVIALVSPELNLMSALVMVVLAGLGVDYGVHLLTHYGVIRAGGREPAEAIRATIAELGASIFAAAASTAVVFATLALAHFEGLKQLGPLGAIGITLALVATVVLFGPLVSVLHRLRPETHSPIREWPQLGFASLGEWRGRAVVGLGVALSVVGLAGGLRAVELETDMSKLRPATTSHGIAWGSAMHGTAKTAFYMLTDTPAELEDTSLSLREANLDSLPELQVITLGSFLPQQQQERLSSLGRLREAVETARDRAPPEQLHKLDRVQELLAPTRVLTSADLPSWLTSWFSGPDGEPAHVGIGFVSLRGRNVEDMEQLAQTLASLREQYPETRFASTSALLGEASMALRDDAPKLLVAAIFAAFLTVMLLGRSLRQATRVLFPLLVAAGWILGLMALLALRINFYNLMVFPLVFGVGIDGAVFLVWARASSSVRELRTRSRAILVSGCTTIAALGSLAVSSNPGIQSIAAAAALTLGTVLVVLLAWWRPRATSSQQ